MAYIKTTWVNGQTPINETNLNHIENGIYDVDQAISDINVPEVKTSNTTSDTDTYSCNFVNGIINGTNVMGNIVVDSIRSKNMLNPNNVISGKYLATTGVYEDGASNFCTQNAIEIDNTKNYVLSAVSGTNKYIMFYDSNNNYLGYKNSSTQSVIANTFSSYSSAKYIQIRFDTSLSNFGNLKVQLEVGDTATTYAPYQELHTEIKNSTTTSNKDAYSCTYVNNLTNAEDYTITPTYSTYTPTYTLKKIGHLVFLNCNSIYLASISANTWTNIATIPDELKPSTSLTTVAVMANGNNGNITGYGRCELQDTGTIRVKMNVGLSSLAFFTFTLVWVV